MLCLCLDLNVWVGAFLAEKYGRQDTAAQSLVEAIRLGQSPRGPVALVISWGMLFRLNTVILRLTGDQATADRLMAIIAAFARDGPALTLGAVFAHVSEQLAEAVAEHPLAGQGHSPDTVMGKWVRIGLALAGAGGNTFNITQNFYGAADAPAVRGASRDGLLEALRQIGGR